MNKPYGIKTSCWVKDEKGGFLAGEIQSGKDDKVMVKMLHAIMVKNVQQMDGMVDDEPIQVQPHGSLPDGKHDPPERGQGPGQPVSALHPHQDLWFERAEGNGKGGETRKMVWKMLVLQQLLRSNSCKQEAGLQRVLLDLEEVALKSKEIKDLINQLEDGGKSIYELQKTLEMEKDELQVPREETVFPGGTSATDVQMDEDSLQHETLQEHDVPPLPATDRAGRADRPGGQ
ncbi:hypothetical protein AAES_13084 [Amazona aestiva]|uniref:Myosin N-terminal SH3-like domain-containing protein n=1 Tax=Amazona aestiva TaxID=12930 RepID=A0A0Q3X811_AMAAE|nr:hypothetical protein AAES_13084 [Amazona aestiva]